MSEMRTMNCPTCDAANQPLAVVDGVQEYRCRSCGLVFYGPCGCDVTYADAAGTGEKGEAELGGDWQMKVPPAEGNGGPGVAKYPGCS
jgi:hypothetical protein